MDVDLIMDAYRHISKPILIMDRNLLDHALTLCKTARKTQNSEFNFMTSQDRRLIQF